MIMAGASSTRPGTDKIANVSASVEAASQALSQLHQSLGRGGFAEGAAAYERMAELLLTQYMWAESQDAPLQEEFEALGDIARRIFSLLEPYTTAMKRLAVLAPPDHEIVRRRVREALAKRGTRGISASTLARELRIERPVLDELLGKLLGEGIVTVRGSGAAAIYSLPRGGHGRPARAPRPAAARIGRGE
jgi:DNA-binding transcriptional ArsR family regulator